MKKNNSVDAKVKAVKEITSMNEELKKWLMEAEKEGGLPKKIKDASEKSKRKPLGKCHICGEKEAKAICIKCGRSVCTACYFHLVGLCQKCLSKNTVEKWKSIRPDWERTLGVEWID